MTADFFAGKRIVLFSLPGALTPTCSTYQFPDFEKLHDEFKAKGIDEIYCISLNDAFVMSAWGRAQGVKNIKLLPDGSGEFTRKMVCWSPRAISALACAPGVMRPCS